MPDERPGERRLFVACELPPEVRDALGGLQDSLRRAGAGRLRWARPEGIHVTLKFLGGVDERRLGEVTAALANAIEPFELRVRPAALGGFGGARIRVVWVGLEGDVDGLAALAARIDGALAPLGFPREQRPFAAHLTLARVPDQASTSERRDLSALVSRYEPPALPSMTFRQVSLMQSTLSPGGSVYTRLASFPTSA